MNDAAADPARLAVVVGDPHQATPAVLEHLLKLQGGVLVKCRRRLVQQQKLGFEGESNGEGYSL